MYLFHSHEVQYFPFKSTACTTSWGGGGVRVGQSLGGCQNPSDKLSTQGPQAMLLGRKPGRGGWSIAAESPDFTLYIMSLSRQRVQSPLGCSLSLLEKLF